MTETREQERSFPVQGCIHCRPGRLCEYHKPSNQVVEAGRALPSAGAAPAPVPPLREQLAALVHEQWSGWMRYLFSKCSDGTIPAGIYIPADWRRRWKRQMETPYADLSEVEKDSDRTEADRVLAVLAGAPSAPAPSPDEREQLLGRMATMLRSHPLTLPGEPADQE